MTSEDDADRAQSLEKMGEHVKHIDQEATKAFAPCRSLIATQRPWTRVLFRAGLKKMSDFVDQFVAPRDMPEEARDMYSIMTTRIFEGRGLGVLLHKLMMRARDEIAANRILYSDLQPIVRACYVQMLQDNTNPMVALVCLMVPLLLGQMADTHGVPCPTMTRQAALILCHPWRGNISYDRNAIRKTSDVWPWIAEAFCDLLPVCDDMTTIVTVIEAALTFHSAEPTFLDELSTFITACAPVLIQHRAVNESCPQFISLLLLYDDNCGLNVDEDEIFFVPGVAELVVGCMQGQVWSPTMESTFDTVFRFVGHPSKHATTWSVRALEDLVAITTLAISNAHQCKVTERLHLFVELSLLILVSSRKPCGAEEMLLMPGHAEFIMSTTYLTGYRRKYTALSIAFNDYAQNEHRPTLLDAYIAVAGAQAVVTMTVETILAAIRSERVVKPTVGENVTLEMVGATAMVLGVMDTDAASWDALWGSELLWEKIRTVLTKKDRTAHGHVHAGRA